MRSKPVATGEQALASQYDSVREDARGAGFLLPHQQLGAFAMPTNPTNGQTITWTINGSAVVETFVSALGTTPGSVLIGLNIAATLVNHLAFLRNPSATNTTQVGAGANAQLIQLVGWAFPMTGTTITPFSLNNVQNTPLSSFTATTTVTGASWTAQTLELYIEAGAYYIGNTRVIYAGGSTPTFTAPSSHPRIDIVTADSSGTIAVTQGSENVSPTAPSYPANKIVICEVYNVVGETALYDFDNQQTNEGYISNDVRPLVAQGGYIASASQVASGLFIADPGSEVQGNILYYGASGWVLLAPGTSGFFLQTQGTSANPQWATFNLPVISGTYSDPGGNTPYSSTKTVTHGLGKRPQFICATISGLIAPLPSGSGTVNVEGYAWLFLDTNGNPQGGIAFQQNVNTSVFAGFSVAPTSCTASGSTSGGTGAASITINNVTTTTFDIVLAATVSAGGARSASFPTVNWIVYG